MAILKDKDACGVNLPYTRVGAVSFEKGLTQCILLDAVDNNREALRSRNVELTQSQQDELSEELLALTYNKLKYFGAIEGVDC